MGKFNPSSYSNSQFIFLEKQPEPYKFSAHKKGFFIAKVFWRVTERRSKFTGSNWIKFIQATQPFFTAIAFESKKCGL